MHEALQCDSNFTPLAVLKTPLNKLEQALDKAIELLGVPSVIVFPWEHAMPFKRQWEQVSGIKTVRDVEAWLWGYAFTYQGVDCFASPWAQDIMVSSIRDLRNLHSSENCVVLIQGQGQLLGR